MGKSKIEWTDETWNPIRGCTTISDGCRNCYAMRMASRFNGPGMAYEGLAAGGKWTGTPRVIESEMDRPLRWRRRRRCFVCSMSDLFHKDVPDGVIAYLFATMRIARTHIFQVLTKRPERLGLMVGEGLAVSSNIWLGTSTEDQATYDARLPHLALAASRTGAVPWLSVEPMLGPIDLCLGIWEPGAGRPEWVVVGGESGPGARPMDPDWVRSIRDQCVERGVAFFFKQWGGVNKKAAGRMLDGRTWDESPR